MLLSLYDEVDDHFSRPTLLSILNKEADDQKSDSGHFTPDVYAIITAGVSTFLPLSPPPTISFHLNSKLDVEKLRQFKRLSPYTSVAKRILKTVQDGHIQPS